MNFDQGNSDKVFQKSLNQQDYSLNGSFKKKQQVQAQGIA